MGCGRCQNAREISKKHYEQYKERYESFLDIQLCTDIYEFCITMAARKNYSQENVEWLFIKVKERFDLNGFDDDFYKMIHNIFEVQHTARMYPHIID